MELALALTAATILADATVTPTVSEMTYNMSSGTLNGNHTQPINQLQYGGENEAQSISRKEEDLCIRI